MKRFHRILAVSVAITAAFGACGGRSPVYEVPPENVPPEARSITLPDPIPAVASYRVDLRRAITTRKLLALAKIRGVAVVAPIDLTRKRVTGPAGRSTVDIATVDPLVFRPVSPVASRDAEFVWTSVLAGEAVLTFDAASQLGVEGAGSVHVPGKGTVRVGAFADNGTPNLADMLVASGLEGVAASDADALVVGVESGVTVEPIGEAIEGALDGAGRVVRLLPEAPGGLNESRDPQAVGSTSGGVIPGMNFEILKNGFIDPDPAWVTSNIAIGAVPILGTVTCHRILFPQLRAALAEIEGQGLQGSIDPSDYGGCYVPRFIDRDPSKPLSMHAFGLAIDLNVSENVLGTQGNMDPRIVAIFGRWGFRWGGAFARPDPMHFELARLVQP